MSLTESITEDAVLSCFGELGHTWQHLFGTLATLKLSHSIVRLAAQELPVTPLVEGWKSAWVSQILFVTNSQRGVFLQVVGFPHFNA